ncbi:hypothetical protein OG234_13440 [Streptomyces sp. NBC_01420]|uniref:hypothetical protein n=1 Tax=Streptomyces sp. NBC_01420 TaxID=2903858 RepID=UPI0032514DE7
MTTPDDRQRRIPGVKYRPVTRYRPETTTINGVPETEQVPYTAWEPVPPRDWDALILRGATVTAIGVSLLAVTSTAASIGGLLHKLIPGAIAYGVACIFSVAWLVCQALEYLARLEPERATKARRVGWLFLLVSMGSVAAFGVDKGQAVAGAVGALVDLIAKGLCVLVLEQYAVPLSRGVAYWLRRRKEKLTADAAATAHRGRLDRVEAYNRAVYGDAELAATQAITTAAEPPVLQPGPAVSGQGTLLPGQVEPAPTAPAPAAPPPAPVAAPTPPVADTSGQSVTVSAPPPAPVPPPVTDTTSTGGAAKPLHVAGEQPGIAPTIRDVLADTPDISDADLVAAVQKVVGDRLNLADTVVRTRRRIEKKKAS